MTVREFFSQLLLAIDYQGDREKLVSDFLVDIKLKALAKARQKISEEGRTSLDQELKKLIKAGNDDTKAYADILNKHISRDVYKDALQNASEEIMRQYLTALQPSLSLEQKQVIGKLMKGFGEPLNTDS